MDSRIALVTQEFLIRSLKRLRDDVLDVRLHKSLKLMKRITDPSGHNNDCSRQSRHLRDKGANTFRRKKAGFKRCGTRKNSLGTSFGKSRRG